MPPLSPEREQALATLRQIDRDVAPLYRHLDLAREGAPWGEAIEGLLEHLDVLTLLTISIPLEQARAALGDEVDWHVLLPIADGGQAGRRLARRRCSSPTRPMCAAIWMALFGS